jgi:putative oxidoreductase
MRQFVPYYDNAKETLLNTYALLVLRLGVGLLMVAGHGWRKLSSYVELSGRFADPIGLGPAASLTLVIFAEFVCSLALIAGFFTRAFAIPLIINMLVAGVIVHGPDPFARKELAIIYLLIYITILIAGPGRISMDAILKQSRQ